MTQIADTSNGSKYTDDDRRGALLEFAVNGSIRKTSEITNIPIQTLYVWKSKEWWSREVASIREDNKEMIDAQLEQLAIKGFQAMADRIENGDTYVTKSGELAKKPVSLRDVSTASGISYDKMRLHRNMPSVIKSESTDERLTQLADKVRELQGGMVTIDQKKPA